MSAIKDMGTTIGTTRGTMTEAQFESLNKTPAKAAEKAEAKYCGLKRGHCSASCALWNGKACAVNNGGEVSAKGICPLSSKSCGENCALFSTGKCSLFS